MKKIIIYFIFLCILFIPLTVSARNDKIEVKFKKCVDGDTATFTYNNKEMKTRFLAVDTPETKHPQKGAEPFGKEASQYTCNALKNANTIELEFDSKSDETDKYDRYLVWVHVDNEILQKQLISKGLAKVNYIYGDYKYLNDLKNLEETAKTEQVGIWGDYVEPANYTIYYIIGGIILLLIILFIRSRTKNKEGKKILNIANRTINKNLKNLFKKL